MSDSENYNDTLMKALTNSSTLVPCTTNASTLWLTWSVSLGVFNHLTL